jgi:capsular exopolysaccharide synthesis family protein
LNLASAKFQRYKNLLIRRWWVLFLAASIGVCMQAYKASSLPTEYVSYARLVAGGQSAVPGAMRESTSDFFSNASELLRSGEVRKRATERVEALNPDLKAVGVSLRVNRSGQSSILNVSAVGGEPKYTVAYLNALLDEFISFRREMREQNTESALNSIMEELIRLEKIVAEKEGDLNSFLSENNLMVLEGQNNRAAQYLSGLRMRKSAMETELSLLELQDLDQDIQRRSQKEEMTGGFGGQTAEGADEVSQGSIDREVMGYTKLGAGERNYLRVTQTIQVLMLDKARKGKTLRERHPEMLAIDEEINRELALLEIYKGQARGESEIRKENMRLQVQNLENQIVEWEDKALDMSSRLSKHSNLSSAIARAKGRYDQMLGTLERVDMSNNLSQDYVSIMERASAAFPQEPDIWKPVTTGLVAGLAIGLLIVVLFDKLDDRMTSFSEFQMQFAEDILGQIPQQNAHGQLQLLEPNDSRHLYGEAFRNLRSSIIFKDWGGRSPRTICICSAVPNEGKTTVAANLGITMALAGARVLLVDADLRRGAMNDLMEMPSNPGFSDVLMGKIDWDEAVRETRVDNLAFLARGEAIDQTSEYVLSDRCTRFLEEVGDSYDYVLFDTAPVLVADDTASFAPKCDAVMFVVRLSSTMARLAAKALGVLYDRQVNVGGVVLNRASTSLKEYSYYNYASYYTARPVSAPGAPEENVELLAESAVVSGDESDGSVDTTMDQSRKVADHDEDDGGVPPVTKI